MEQTFSSNEYIIMAVIIILIMAIVSIIFDIITKKAKETDNNQHEYCLFRPQSEYEKLHWGLIKQMRFIEDVAYYDEEFAKRYHTMEQEAIALRNIIKKERGFKILWREGDPHPFKEPYKWAHHVKKIKGGN
jgi:hypothetical protein